MDMLFRKLGVKYQYFFLTSLLIAVIFLSSINLSSFKYQSSISTFEEFSYTESTVIKLLYSGSRTPADFYNHNLIMGEKIYDDFYYHRSGGHTEPWEFFSTNDLTEARNLVDKNLKSSSVSNKNISETTECEKYFEFKTVDVREGGRVYIRRHRVHKSSYIYLKDAYTFPAWWPDLNDQRTVYLGAFNQKPYTFFNLKEFVEYLWFIEYHGISGLAFFDTFISENENDFSYSILEVRLRIGDWGMQDKVTLTYVKFTINKDNGSISLFQHCFDEFYIN